MSKTATEAFWWQVPQQIHDNMNLHFMNSKSDHFYPVSLLCKAVNFEFGVQNRTSFAFRMDFLFCSVLPPFPAFTWAQPLWEIPNVLFLFEDFPACLWSPSIRKSSKSKTVVPHCNDDRLLFSLVICHYDANVCNVFIYN